MLLATTIQSEKGKTLQKTANEYIRIVLTVEKKEFCTLILKEKKNIVEPMNYTQNTEGYVLEIEDINKQVYFKLKQ